MQAAANLVNDAKDAENGIDSEERKGPKRAVQSGLLSLNTVKNAYRFCFGVSILLSLVIAYYGGIYVLYAALISAVFAYAYTGDHFLLLLCNGWLCTYFLRFSCCSFFCILASRAVGGIFIWGVVRSYICFDYGY